MRYLVLIFFIWAVQRPVVAQVTFIAPTQFVVEGSGTVSTAIRLQSADTLTTAQFTLSWDTTVLNFFLVDSFGLPGMSADNFGTSNVGSGKLTFVWIDNSASGLGIRFRDSIRAFRLVFRLRGHANSFSNVAFVDAPTRTKATNASFVNLPIIKQDGRITVTARVSTEAPEVTTETPLTLFQNIPNPCTEWTTLPFETATSGIAACHIYDLKGQEIWSGQQVVQAGYNSFNIATSSWLSGSYVYVLKMGHIQQTRILIKK